MKTQNLRQSKNVEDWRDPVGKVARHSSGLKNQRKIANNSEHLLKKEEFKNITPSEYDNMISEYINTSKEGVETKTRKIMNLIDTHKPQPIRELKDDVYPRPYFRKY